jgi:4-hydroxy-tetrahydrodipicolinate reductase
MKTVKAVLYGIGAVGSLVAKFLLQKEGIEIVGALDIAEAKIGKDLGRILSINEDLGIVISDDPTTVLSETKPHIVIHTTSSYLKDVYSQLEGVVNQGVDVVSTCEELSYPFWPEPQLAQKLDTLARKNHATILGTGINPGFLMDTLVIALTAVCQKIQNIRAVRVIDASTRRAPFQKKIGAGLTIDEFHDALNSKLITGHVGLAQSIAMVSSALAWELSNIETDPVEPIIARTLTSSKAVEVNAGQVAGLRQIAKGYRQGNEVITLDFQAYIGAKEEYDSITIEGMPRVSQKISPCVHGDRGTIAMIVNTIPKVINAPPGLITMKDLPVPSAATEPLINYLR